MVVEVLGREPDNDGEEEEDFDTEAESDDRARLVWDEDDDRLYMDVARVYEHTIVQLGKKLGDVLGAIPQPDQILDGGQC